MMRKPKSANQDSSLQHSSSVHYFAIAVMILTACSIVLSGCSKFRVQEPSFNPIAQPNSLTQQQQQSVEATLAKQDASRMAAQKEAAMAELANQEAEATETDADADSAAVAAIPAPVDDLQTQQQDIIADAAQRASFAEAMTQIAQVSYESEIDPSEEAPTVDESIEAETTEVEAALESVENGVRLIANADDFTGVPVNNAEDEIDFSQANLLRSGATALVAEQASPSFGPLEESAPTPFGNAEALQLPLQPMLFNPESRTTKTIYEGTLRPLAPAVQEFESDTEVTRTSTEPTSQAAPEFNSFVDPARAFGALAPLRTRSSTIKLENTPTHITSSSANSRLLRPLARETNEVIEPPKVDVSPVEFTKTIPEPIVESAEIIVVDPPSEPKPLGPRIAEIPHTPLPSETHFPGQPVVDESLLNASASYLRPIETETEETYIPAEVIQDAIVVAQDMERELTATVIPSESASENNDFKVQAVSSTSVVSLCPDCGTESCAGCEIDHDHDRGEPMFANNDFAAPTIPGGDFVAPMAIPPAIIPTAQPKEIIPATSNFGAPVSLDAPPETDSSIKHVAALPIAGHTTGQPVTTSNVPPVGISTLMELNAVTWKSRLDEAIELAEARLNRMNTPTDSGRVNLRLLKALRSQMEQVENAPGSLQHSENESRYWQHQLEAITAMVQAPTGDSQAVTDYHRHQAAHETLEHLRNAVSQLESIASLKVTSGQFCTAISGFGKYHTFPSSTFSPGQKMLIYCEVENYTSVENQSVTGGDFRTRLRGSFAIYNADGNVVQQAEFPSVDDISRKRRRDFYMYLPVTLADDLPSGEYVLHALVEDIYGNKTASLDPPLKFSVK